MQIWFRNRISFCRFRAIVGCIINRGLMGVYHFLGLEDRTRLPRKLSRLYLIGFTFQHPLDGNPNSNSHIRAITKTAIKPEISKL